MKQFEQWQDQIARLFPEYMDKYGDSEDRVLSQTITFQVTDACDLACFASGTKILMSDFSYKNIEDVKIGDEVLAFDEHTEKGKQIKCMPTKVTHTFYRHDFVRKIKTVDGEEIVCTNEHPFLDGRRQWVRAEDINTDKKLTKFVGIDEYTPADINSLDYMIGYVISAFLGDGSIPYYKHGILRTEPLGYQSRLAVKDTEIIKRTCQYLDKLNISYTLRPFKVSIKYNITEDAIYLNLDNSLKLKNLIEENWLINHSYNYLCGFLAGIIDTEGTVTTNCTRIFNSNDKILQQCEEALKKLGFAYTYDKEKQSKNVLLKTIRILNPRNTLTIIRLLLTIQNAVKRKYVSVALYKNHFKRVDVQAVENLYSYVPVYNLETELHTYIANNCSVHNCNYCYQIHKGKRRMSFETAKKYIDLIISGEKGFHEYINPQKSPGIIVEFIGGEPFLEIDLIDKICDYFTNQLIEKQHPWATKYMFSICSNGVSYFDERVQRFLRKWHGHISFSVTIDGNKELHDSCRVFPDGSPSYDLAVAAAKDWMSKGYQMGSKITIAPGNVTFFYDAIKHMIELGYTEINANCVYEKGWEPKHAIVLYEEMKKVSDYFLENNLDFDYTYFCSLFDAKMFHPKDETDLQNWCFKAGTQVLTPSGNRNIEDLHVGDKVISGFGQVQYVESVKTRHATDTCKLKIAGMEPLYTTPEHPILAKVLKENQFLGWTWVNASELKTNDEVGVYKYHSLIGAVIKSVPVEYQELSEPYDVYNLTVSNEHTFVANGVIVHNCGGVGSMLSCDPDGYLFPCIRYMESSLGSDQEPYSIGHVDVGICQTECDKCRLDCLKKIDRRTQSTDECFNCPIAEGCSWCFKAGTLITTPDGFKEIQNIQVGDKVITGSGNIETVEKINSRYTDDTVYIQGDGLLPLYTTSEHPFWVRKYNSITNTHQAPAWVNAADINTNDQLAVLVQYNMHEIMSLDYINNDTGYYHGQLIMWVNVNSVNSNIDGYTVYNMSVSNEHTYLANGAIVHNCSAYNYQVFGTPDARATYICIMHKARALGNIYFWNKYYRQHGRKERMKIYIPDEWALEIINQKELDMLKDLAKED